MTTHMPIAHPSYIRVIPRDLFNEANLLKCYGQLYLNLEVLRLEHHLVHNGGAFRVYQDQSDGSLSILNVKLMLRGSAVKLWRPLNARAAYPLWCAPDEETDFLVFDEAGKFTPHMLELLSAKAAPR